MTKRIIYLSAAFLVSGALSSLGYAQDEYSARLIPPTYRSVVQTTTLQEATERQIIIPEEFRTVTDVYLTVEAHCPGDQLVEQTSTIEIEPAYTKIEPVSGKYDTVTEIIVRPGTAEWRATPGGSFEYVTTAPVERSVTRRVETRAPSHRYISVPGKTLTLVSQRRATGAGLPDCADVIPARTRTVQRRVLVTAPQIRTIAIPAKTSQTTQRILSDQTLAIAPNSGGPSTSLSLDRFGPTNPTADTLYKPEVRNERCVLWKSFSKEDAIVEKGRFPWPPPNPSTESTLPEGMFAGVETLGDMNRRLISALDALGYQDRRRKYYPVPHGFALVTEIEQIDDTGRPLSGTSRWTNDIYVIDPPSVLGWLKALVTRATGRFRVFALIVTSEDVNTEGTFDDREIALDWLNSGTGALNRDRAACAFTASHRVTALVYEFEHSERQEPFLVSNTLINHIAGSGLRAQLAKVGTRP